jgi:hypothetical protein
MYTMSLHGHLPNIGEYWFGGSSGACYIYANKKFYNLYTGIGGLLYGVATNGGALVVVS